MRTHDRTHAKTCLHKCTKQQTYRCREKNKNSNAENNDIHRNAVGSQMQTHKDGMCWWTLWYPHPPFVSFNYKENRLQLNQDLGNKTCSDAKLLASKMPSGAFEEMYGNMLWACQKWPLGGRKIRFNGIPVSKLAYPDVSVLIWFHSTNWISSFRAAISTTSFYLIYLFPSSTTSRTTAPGRRRNWL